MGIWELDGYETEDLDLAISYMDGLASLGFEVSDEVYDAVNYELNKRDNNVGN